MQRGWPNRGPPQQCGGSPQTMGSSPYGGGMGTPQQQQQQQRRGGAFGTTQSDGFLARLERVETDTKPTTAGGSAPITLENWAQRSKQLAQLIIANEAREMEARARLAQVQQRR